jgi:hypothetical protein
MIARRLARVIVIANKLLFYFEMMQKFAGDTGILTGYRSYATQCRYRPQGDVAQIANWRGDNVKSWGERRVHAKLMDRHEGSVK